MVMTTVDTYNIFYIHIHRYMYCIILSIRRINETERAFYNICQEDPVYQVFQHHQYFIIFMQQVNTLRCSRVRGVTCLLSRTRYSLYINHRGSDHLSSQKEQFLTSILLH